MYVTIGREVCTSGNDDLASVHPDSLDQSERSFNSVISRMCMIIAIKHRREVVFDR